LPKHIPEAYDAIGKQVSHPFGRRKSPRSTFPIGRYVSQPLTIKCSTLEEIREFLRGCKYVSDKELFDRDEYWQPPDEFEQRKQGDCEDFALWTWRQLLDLGYGTRFIGGRCGRYGEGHAWVEYFQDGRCYLLEPLYCKVGIRLPQLSTYRYEPKFSVSWDGKQLRYFAHKKPETRIGWPLLAPLILEYLLFWTWFWLKNFYRIPRVLWKMFQQRVFRRDLWLQRKREEK
jgi:hypothetical protein